MWRGGTEPWRSGESDDTGWTAASYEGEGYIKLGTDRNLMERGVVQNRRGLLNFFCVALGSFYSAQGRLVCFLSWLTFTLL